MTGELYINERDAWAVWGVNMAEGFLDTIDAPLPMKEYIEDESRLEDGIRIDTSNPKVDSREITLGFTITGNSETDYRSKKSAFQSELQKGMIRSEPRPPFRTFHDEMHRAEPCGQGITNNLLIVSHRNGESSDLRNLLEKFGKDFFIIARW